VHDNGKSRRSGRGHDTNNLAKAVQIIVIEIGNGDCASVQRRWHA
jgi:hypothetical protein